MSDELRAAAERVVDWYDRDGSVGGAADPIEELRNHLAEHPTDVPNDSLVGCKIVAVGSDNSLLVDSPSGSRRRVWMVEKHPADDDGDKPWDSDWLLSIGGKRDGYWINIECEKCYLAFLPEVSYAGEVKIEDEGGCGPWVRCETRRKVRDLIRVLNGGE